MKWVIVSIYRYKNVLHQIVTLTRLVPVAIVTLQVQIALSIVFQLPKCKVGSNYMSHLLACELSCTNLLTEEDPGYFKPGEVSPVDGHPTVAGYRQLCT